jgi:hypothetical protein
LDERQDKNIIEIKYPKIGSLVKIITHYFDYYKTTEEVEYGIVIDHKPVSDNQIRMFPEVSVYTIKDNKIKTVPLSGLEIVSN